MDKKIKILSGSFELLDRIVPLWEELIKHHVEKSVHFSEVINSRKFEQRKNDLISKARDLLAEIVLDVNKNIDVGYSISTIDDNDVGEIDSLFIKEPYRKNGIGERLTKNALMWLDNNAVTKKVLSVGAGNEEVISFYNNFNFYPASILLIQKDPPPEKNR